MAPLPPFKEGVLLKDYTTYQVGGPAKEFVTVSSVSEMRQVVLYLIKNQKRYFVLGKGSNTLFDDRGFDGVIIYSRIRHIEWDNLRVRAGSGYGFPLLSSKAARKNLGGLEFAAGIPGTVGGAIFMNAGASDSETKDALVEVEYINERGELCTRKKEECDFSYRFSIFQTEPTIIVSATFALHKNEGALRKKNGFVLYRLKTQPYKEKTCGSVFRNPQATSAGALIEKKLGLKGYRIGDAEISPKHANFIVNRGKATSSEIQALIEFVQKRAYEEVGEPLLTEVRIVSYQEESSYR